MIQNFRKNLFSKISLGIERRVYFVSEFRTLPVISKSPNLNIPGFDLNIILSNQRWF
jgi:hypothetical protein